MRTLLTALATLAVLAAIAVLSPGTVPYPIRNALGIGPTPLGAAPQVASGGSYRFMQHQPGNPGAPVAYDPCRVIHVRVNTDGVVDPSQALAIVRSAMTEVSRDTGLRLKYDGSSSDRPRWRPGQVPVVGPPGPVLVSFATSDEVPQLAGQVAGVGGSTSVTRGGTSTYVTGQVTLDIDSFDDMLGRPAFHDAARAIVMHELGHLVGLAHVQDRAELMYAKTSEQTEFGPGDLRGLALLGKGRCR